MMVNYRALVDIECHDNLDFPSNGVAPQSVPEVAMNITLGPVNPPFRSSCHTRFRSNFLLPAVSGAMIGICGAWG